MTEITYITPDARRKLGLFRTWVVMLRNIISSRELIIQLFQRDFLRQYKRSFLGATWLLLAPLIAIASWIFLNSAGILNPGDVGIPFPAYVLLSSSIWGLFMGFFGSASNTLSSGSDFIKQVNFPHEALLVKQTLQHVINFGITFLLNILVLLAFQVTPSWHIILLPIITLPLFFLGAGIGLMVSVINVVATDVSKIFTAILGFTMYITPVIYAPKTDNALLQSLIDINPLTYLIGGVRDMIIYGRIDSPERFLVASFASFIFFMLSLRLFYVSEERVIEKMFN